MRNVWKRGLVAVAMSALLLCLGAGTAFAQEVVVTPSAGSDAFRVIQDKLDEAKSKAMPSHPYTVRVAKGSYTLGTGLRIYGNTTLKLDGVTLTMQKGKDGNIIKVGDAGNAGAKGDRQQGYYYKNVHIVGGTLNGNGNSSTVVKAAHAQNVSLTNVTVKNTRNAHLMEVAGVNGLRIENCTFRDQVLDKDHATLTPEAIQIDVLVPKHMNGYRCEDLPMKNIVVNKCTFTNVPRGVGSHSSILNNYVDGVTITNNTFTNMGSAAIQGMNYINCFISGNVIKNSPRGIALYTVNTKGVFFGSTAGSDGVASKTPKTYRTPPANQNIVITRNSIDVRGKERYTSFTNEGIIVNGYKFTKALKKSSATDAIPKGDYYASGVTITDNVISTIGHGIRMHDAKNSTVARNTIMFTGPKKGGTAYYGIELLEGSSNVAVTDNTIKNAKANGIFIIDSTASAVTGNVISAPGKYGIGLQKGSATKIAKNKISKPKTCGIFLSKSSKAKAIESNTISSSKGYGVSIDTSSVNSLSKNTITSPKNIGIMVKAKSKVKKIASNSIKSGKNRGIAIYAPKCAMSVTKNKISTCKAWGIYVDGKSKAYKITVKSNKITGKASVAKVKVVSGKVKVSGSKKA